MKHLSEALSKSQIRKIEKHPNDKYLLVVPFNDAFYGSDFKPTHTYVAYYGKCNNQNETEFAIVKNGPEIEELKKKVKYPDYYFHLYKFTDKYNSVTQILKDINDGKIIVSPVLNYPRGLEIIFGKEYEF